ncbi:sulfotransferase domain-containing protein [Gloeocapsa sp. PCC 73106]|uniref:sulfotransferase domain-containing protein n=1 Tax=Gloeocapsa sp. PCC 73106 TaxID=102232 RepID=UPI0002ABAF74|nr:sulfotransferase domain-containing protein [Gloeocapsa sp. PCC 73106]ELS00033.1 sulfotransferase family protein [Gloeocapsa sp. PCC 73106]
MKLLIHIGYPKTASSWLQKSIFNNKDLGVVAPWGQGKQAVEAINYFYYPDDLNFTVADTYCHFLPGIEQANLQNLVPILSHEYLSVRIGAISYPKLVADRLAQVFPEAKILLFIREQKKIILSTYQEYIKNQGVQTLEQALDENNYTDGKLPAVRPSLYKYDVLISYYQQLFGKDQVLVIPFELFKSNNLDVVIKILDFVDAKYESNSLSFIDTKSSINSSYKLAGIPIRRKISQLVGQQEVDNSRRNSRIIFFNRVNKFINYFLPEALEEKQKKYLEKVVKQYVKDMFNESNQRTSELIGVDLAKLGYSISS